MDTRCSFEKAYIILIDFILPFPLTGVMFHVWNVRTGSPLFAAYVILLGVLFGYIVPGIGTNFLHLWRFYGPLRVGGYFVHHGFMYSPYFALVFLISFGTAGEFSSARIASVIVCNAFVQSLASCHHDLCCLKIGMVQIYNTPWRHGKSPVEIIADYGPVGFGLFGASYALSCLWAYSTFVLDGERSLSTMALGLAGGVGLMALTSVPYVIREREYVLSVICRKWTRAGRYMSIYSGRNAG
jgi:hypothetical protein